MQSPATTATLEKAEFGVLRQSLQGFRRLVLKLAPRLSLETAAPGLVIAVQRTSNGICKLYVSDGYKEKHGIAICDGFDVEQNIGWHQESDEVTCNGMSLGDAEAMLSAILASLQDC